MVQLTALFAILALSSPLAFSHPINRPQLDGNSLLESGQKAQVLNAQFETLKPTDSCTNDDVACVQGALALCRAGGWVTQNCPETLQCFALPDVDQVGVTIGCTSSQTASSLIEATGAQGGIDGSSGTNSTLGSNANSVQTVTVTVTLPQAIGQTQTLSPVTTTLTPDQAGNLVSAAAATSTTTDSTSTATSTDPAVVGAVNTGAAAGTTIVLSTATASSAPPAVTPPADPNSGVQGGIAAAPAPPAGATTVILNGAPAADPTPAITLTASTPLASTPGGSGY